MEILLWLDDVRPMPDGYTHWVKTAKEAIDLIETGNVVTCSLDHDLGDNQQTGYEVAKYIEENACLGKLQKIRCKVHSQNPVGKSNMQMALRNAYKAWMNL